MSGDKELSQQPSDTTLHVSLANADRLLPRLSRRFPSLSQDLLHDALVDALMDWLCTSRGPGPVPDDRLYRYAWRNAANIVRGEKRRRTRELRSWRLSEASSTAIREQESVEQLVDSVRRTLPDKDMQGVFDIWIAGGRDSSAFARALAITHMSPPEQTKRVKREKDRMLKYLRRSVAVQQLAQGWLRVRS